MMKRKRGMLRKGIGATVAVLTMFASASTILAYEPFESTNESALEVYEGGDFASFIEEYQTDEGGLFTNGDDIRDYDFSGSDRVFIYEDGTQEPILLDEESTYAFCNHTLVSGYYSIHKP